MALNIEDPPSLLSYLRDAGHIPAQARPRFRTLGGGVSNRTVLVERTGASDWVLKQPLRRLRVASEWLSDPLRIHAEARGLEFLPRLTPAGTITPLVFEDFDQHVLAMVAVPSPHWNWSQLLLRGTLASTHVEQCAQILGMMHSRGRQQAGDLAGVFSDKSYFVSLRLDPYYRFSAEQVPSAREFLLSLIEQTQAVNLSVVHGDYSPKNMLVHEGRLVLLDHEVIHFGDPAFDVGFLLTHLLSKANHLPERRALFAEAAVLFWQVYRQAAPEIADHAGYQERVVHHALACLLARVAGRSQLEYLSNAARTRQRGTALQLMSRSPVTVPELVESFEGQL